MAKAQVGSTEEARHKLAFDGQASAHISYSPHEKLTCFIGGRYLPQLAYTYNFKNRSTLHIEGAANIYGSALFLPFDSLRIDGGIKPYRVWGRYAGKQYEIRIGLQKINFGTAMMLRSLQWFDKIDPRDPLTFTTGVYGALGKYYFLNNANIWAWILYGNGQTKGFEVLTNHAHIPEWGGRIQYPMSKGEIAATYHHRTANSQNRQGVPTHRYIPENRYALDGKWDIGIGLWFEAAYIHKTKKVGILTHQTYLTLGGDYTFNIGNGLQVTLEHLLSGYDEKAFAFEHTLNVSATSIVYPLGFFDRISTMAYYAWKSGKGSLFISYEHQFKRLAGYVMAYYNPDTSPAMGSAQYENSFSGPGIRLMLVYNH
ncbi:MAG: hypothetical protein CSA04_01890 [Bacteroidetes bacterium]|nr:MAG: hypothetical protein CSA04_01890 [Bacteroidota bacterium]